MHLFREGRAGFTLLLWVVNFMNITMLYSLSNWLPTVVTGMGYSTQTAVLVGTVLQVGGTIGTFGLAWLIARRGFIPVLTATFAVAAISIAFIGQPGISLALLMAIVFVAGWCVVGGQPGLNALSGTYYPTYLRSTGVGAGLGVGRAGGILGPYIGGVLLAQQWSSQQLFWAAALPAVVSTLTIAAMGAVVGGALGRRTAPTSAASARLTRCARTDVARPRRQYGTPALTAAARGIYSRNPHEIRVLLDLVCSMPFDSAPCAATASWTSPPSCTAGHSSTPPRRCWISSSPDRRRGPRSRWRWSPRASPRPATPTTDIEWHAPIPRPRKNIACLGMNYSAHIQETAAMRGKDAKIPQVPVIFTKAPTTVNRPFGDIVVDRGATSQVDWEVELGVVIGRTGKNIHAAARLRLRLRLHRPQRRDGARPAEEPPPVLQGQEPRRLLPDGPGGGDGGRVRRPAAQAARVPRERRGEAGRRRRRT